MRKLTKVHKKNIGIANTGKRRSEKTKKQMSKVHTKIPTKKLILDENLGYILGTIMGDGNISKNNQINLGVKDKDFALVFKKTLEEWSGMKISFHFYEKYNDIYKVELGSKYVSKFLKNFDINKIKTSSKKCKKMFLRGMYDSEGCVSFYKYTNGVIRAISITNNNKQLLQLCKNLLTDLDIESNNIRIESKKGDKHGYGYYKKNHYGFTINKKENFIKFKDLVSFSIKRKRNILIKIINSYKKK